MGPRWRGDRDSAVVETRHDNLTYALLLTSLSVTVCGCLRAEAALSSSNAVHARAMLAKECCARRVEMLVNVSASSTKSALAKQR